MRILPAGDADEAQLVALWERTGLVRPWNDPVQDLRRARDGATSEVLVAADDGPVVGSAMVGLDGHRGWLYYLAVEPSRQGTGLGRALVAAAEAWLAARGAPKAQLMVRSGNDAVLGFYERLGYERQDVVVLGKRF